MSRLSAFIRRHLFEFEDQPWLPAVLRRGITDYMEFMFSRLDPFAPVVPLLIAELEWLEVTDILDLCSGSGGPVGSILERLTAAGRRTTVTLTDRYPNLEAFERLRQRHGPSIRFEAEPVDATRTPPRPPGFRTVFNAFHHFPPEQARALLEQAVRANDGIGIFEVTDRSLKELVRAVLTPVALCLVTPAMRPVRPPKLFLTYAVPLIPFVLGWDALVSCLRVYSAEEARALLEGVPAVGYEWRSGVVRSEASRIDVYYVIGRPPTIAADGRASRATDPGRGQGGEQ